MKNKRQTHNTSTQKSM